MRKFLVKNFVGYYHFQSSIAKEISDLLFLASIAIVSLTGLKYPRVISIMTFISLLLEIIPFKTKVGSALRASRICWPGFSIPFIIIAATLPLSWAWYHIVLCVWMILLSWVSWSWFGLGYFEIFKVHRSELDAQQLEDYLNDRIHYNLKVD